MNVNTTSHDFKEEDFNQIVEIMRELLFKRKEVEYNIRWRVHDYFVHGKLSYDQMLWVKCLREINRRDGDMSNDFDTLKDLIAYSMFALDYAHKQSSEQIAVAGSIPNIESVNEFKKEMCEADYIERRHRSRS